MQHRYCSLERTKLYPTPTTTTSSAGSSIINSISSKSRNELLIDDCGTESGGGGGGKKRTQQQRYHENPSVVSLPSSLLSTSDGPPPTSSPSSSSSSLSSSIAVMILKKPWSLDSSRRLVMNFDTPVGPMTASSSPPPPAAPVSNDDCDGEASRPPLPPPTPPPPLPQSPLPAVTNEAALSCIVRNRDLLCVSYVMAGLLAISLIASFATIMSMQHRQNNNDSSIKASGLTLPSASLMVKERHNNGQLLDFLIKHLERHSNKGDEDGDDDSEQIHFAAPSAARLPNFPPRLRGKRSASVYDLLVQEDSPYVLVSDNETVHFYEYMHELWSTEPPNSLSGNGKPSLSIFWSFNHLAAHRLPNSFYFYALSPSNRNACKRRDPVSFEFADISPYLNYPQRVELIRESIRDAFNEWARILEHRVNFYELPYLKQLRDHGSFNRVLVISFLDPRHMDEHTGQMDRFPSQHTIAHASYNSLHLNNQHSFRLIPRRIAGTVPVAFNCSTDQLPLTWYDDCVGPRRLFLLDRATFRSFFNLSSYAAVFRKTVVPSFATNGGGTSASQTTPVNFVSVLLHEIGHVLGLGHYLGRLDQQFRRFQRRTGESIDQFAIRVLQSTSLVLEQRHSIMTSFYNQNLSSLTAVDQLAGKLLFDKIFNHQKTTDLDSQ